MTTATKTKTLNKRTWKAKDVQKPVTKNGKRRGRPPKLALLPEHADLASIAGKEYVIMPREVFEDWQDDRLLSLLVQLRMERGDKVVPFEDIAITRPKQKRGR